jgi:cytochrome oxidase assembly protein ShyY1
LQYAITWYGLAAVLIVMLLVWMRTQPTARGHPLRPDRRVTRPISLTRDRR